MYFLKTGNIICNYDGQNESCEIKIYKIHKKLPLFMFNLKKDYPKGQFLFLFSSCFLSSRVEFSHFATKNSEKKDRLPKIDSLSALF